MGYIKIDRKLFDHWLWNTNEPFTRGQAWIDLIQLANYKNETEVYNGQNIARYRGQINCSELWLANRWKWSRGKTSRFMEQLVEQKMIDKVSTTHGTTITLLQYDCYQDGGTTDRTTLGTTDSATDGATAPVEPQGFEPLGDTTDDTTLDTTLDTTDGAHKKNISNKENQISIYCAEIIDHLNRVTGSQYRANTTAYKKLINARLSEGYTVDDCIKVINNKYQDWKGTKYEQYLRPQTLFAKTHFDDYLNCTPRKTNSNPFLSILEAM